MVNALVPSHQSHNQQTPSLPTRSSSLPKRVKDIFQRHVNPLKVFRKKPPNVVFETVMLPGENEKSILYQRLIAAYRIEPTRWQRSYPSVGIDMRLPGYRRDEIPVLYIRSLLRDIIKYAQQFDVPLSIEILNPDQLELHTLCDYLDLCVGELFPHLTGISLNTPSTYRNSFLDDDIIHAESDLFSVRQMELGIGIPSVKKPVFSSLSGEPSLGCSVAMLLYELKISETVYREFYKVKEMDILERKLAQHKLQLTQVYCNDLHQLHSYVSSQPTIVFVNSFQYPPTPFTNTPHCVVVDEIIFDKSTNLYCARVRDSYHKWKVTIKGNAFSNSWISDYPVLMIQPIRLTLINTQSTYYHRKNF